MCYWKNLWNLGNTLGNHWKIVQTHCEHKTSKNPIPLPITPNKNHESIRWILDHFIGWTHFLFLIYTQTPICLGN
jgi:hypothetical protein